MTLVGTIELAVTANTVGLPPELLRKLDPIASTAGKDFGAKLSEPLAAKMAAAGEKAGTAFAARVGEAGVKGVSGSARADAKARQTGEREGKEAGEGFLRKGKEGVEKFGELAGTRLFSGFARQGAIAFASIGAADFIRDSVKDAEKAERAQLGLANGISKNVQLTRSSYEAFNQLAESLGKTTTFSKTQVVASESVSASFRLNERQIKTLTPLVLDFAAKFGVDAAQATRLFDRAATGLGTGALGRLGIAIDKTKAKTDPFGAAVDALRLKAGGFANQEGQTFEGRLKRLGNRFEEVRVGVGEKLIPVFSNLIEFSLRAGRAVERSFGPAFRALVTEIRGLIDQARPQLTELFGLFRVTFGGGGDFIRTKLLPAVGAIGQVLVDDVLPIMVDFAKVVAGQVLPALSVAGQFLVQILVPAVQKLGKFIGDNKPLFEALGGAVLAGVVAFKLYNGVVAIAAAVSKAFTAAQVALDLALNANPISIIIIAVAALAAGFVIAYKQSETFRNVVKSVGIIALNVFAGIVEAVATLARGYLAAFDAILKATAKVADAFGFHGLAQKLDEARGVIDGFANNVLGDLDGLAVAAKAKADAIGASIAAGVNDGFALSPTIDGSFNDQLTQQMAKAKAAAQPAAKKIGSSVIDNILAGLRDTAGAAPPLFADAVAKAARGDSPAVRAAKLAGKAISQALGDEIARTRVKLTGLDAERKRFDDFRAKVLGSANAFDAVTNLISDPENATAGRLIASLRKKLLGERGFTRDLGTLQRRGLNQDILSQLAEAGPAQRSLAAALARATPAQIRQIDALDRATTAQKALLANQAKAAAFGSAPERTAREIVQTNKLLTQLIATQRAQPAKTGQAVAAAQARDQATKDHAARAGVRR